MEFKQNIQRFMDYNIYYLKKPKRINMMCASALVTVHDSLAIFEAEDEIKKINECLPIAPISISDTMFIKLKPNTKWFTSGITDVAPPTRKVFKADIAINIMGMKQDSKGKKSPVMNVAYVDMYP